MTEQYRVFEAELTGTEKGNPYTDVWLKAAFQNDAEKIEVNGFYCGNGIYKIRFMPAKPGVWNAVTRSNDPLLNNMELLCECVAAGEGNHGRVLRKNEVLGKDGFSGEDSFHFMYEDGTKFQPFGTTCYAWINQEEEIQEQTLETLKNSCFNKVRMCIFPKYYTYNTKIPSIMLLKEMKQTALILHDFIRPSGKIWRSASGSLMHLELRQTSFCCIPMTGGDSQK